MESFLSRLSEIELQGVPLDTALTLLLAWAITLTLFALIRKVLLQRFRKLVQRTRTVIDDMVVVLFEQTKLYFLAVVSLYVSVWIIPISDQVVSWIGPFAMLFVLIQIIVWGNRLITDWVRHYRESKIEDDAAAVTSMQAVGFVARLLLYTIVLLIALDNFGVDVTALIAGLGVGGIAVALALQNILGDLFASLSIVLDKPFVVGDFLIVDDYLGTVEKVGLKTTRLRSLSGEQIVFANGDLLNSRIRNNKRMAERRILFSFGVVYDTAYDRLKEIPTTVRQIIEAQEHARFDRAHFKGYGESSLDFEVVYYVQAPDYLLYMDTQQAINLELFRVLQERGIEFAFPTRTVYVASSGESAKESDAGRGGP